MKKTVITFLTCFMLVLALHSQVIAHTLFMAVNDNEDGECTFKKPDALYFIIMDSGPGAGTSGKRGRTAIKISNIKSRISKVRGQLSIANC